MTPESYACTVHFIRALCFWIEGDEQKAEQSVWIAYSHIPAPVDSDWEF